MPGPHKHLKVRARVKSWGQTPKDVKDIIWPLAHQIPLIRGGDITCSRGGQRHLQIGRMLDIDLMSEPSPPTPPSRCLYKKCENLCGQRGRKRFIASWSLRMSHICPCTPCPSPPGYRSKVESRHFAHLWSKPSRIPTPDPMLKFTPTPLSHICLYSYATTPVALGVFLYTSEARKREEVERTVSNHSVVMPSP